MPVMSGDGRQEDGDRVNPAKPTGMGTTTYVLAAYEIRLTPNGVSAGIRRMIKTRIAAATLALSVMAAGACFGASPQMGTWKLNESKSKLIPGMGKNNTVTYSEMGDKVKVTVEGMDKDGKATRGVWVGKWDGKPYPNKTKGAVGWDTTAYKVVNDHTNNITTWKDGKVAWSGTITVAADGKSRTVTMNGTDANGKKFKGKAVYDKS